MRTLWKGAISFGLVNVPVKLFTATENKDLKFHYLHEKCKTPLKYERRCPVCNVTVSAEEIVWGYEYEKDQYVVLREEDFRQIPDNTSKTIDIIDFVDLQEIDPIYFEKSYFLEPSGGGEKAYALLRKAMQDTRKIAIAKVTIRAKETLAVLRVYENMLLMEIIFYPDEIRSAAGLTALQTLPALEEREIQMAVNLINNLSSHFEPTKYTNDYRARLMELIQTKIAGGEITKSAPQESGKIIDLMEALRASIAATENDKTDASDKPSKRRKTRTKTG